MKSILGELKRRKVKRREMGLLLFTAAFGLAAICFWAPLSRGVLSRLLLWADAPTGEVVSELVLKSNEPASLLERLWRTDKIPHRLLAVASLKRHIIERPALYERLQPLLLTASQDADLEVRTLALETLAAQRHPVLPRLAREQLDDADPAARVLGLRLLQKTRRMELVPVVMPLLEDRDSRVVVSAAGVLRAWTGQDFGIRLSQARPEFKGPLAAEPKADDLERLSKGVQRWKEWWNEHRNQYPNSQVENSRKASPARFRAPGFSLESLDGRSVRLDDFRGQVVLLSLWDTKTPESLAQLSVLDELQRWHPQGLVVLGISLDSTAAGRSCEEEHAHEHSHHAPAKPDLAHLRSVVQETVEPMGLNFPILIDPDGAVGKRYGCEELPTLVLIDGDGMVRRRFAGGRSVTTLEAMINYGSTSSVMAPKRSVRHHPRINEGIRMAGRIHTQMP